MQHSEATALTDFRRCTGFPTSCRHNPTPSQSVVVAAAQETSAGSAPRLVLKAYCLSVIAQEEHRSYLLDHRIRLAGRRSLSSVYRLSEVVLELDCILPVPAVALDLHEALDRKGSV
jgi:hypothetical protein